jgi:hypothetical protein
MCRRENLGDVMPGGSDDPIQVSRSSVYAELEYDLELVYVYGLTGDENLPDIVPRNSAWLVLAPDIL